jgi:hypothetical protein
MIEVVISITRVLVRGEYNRLAGVLRDLRQDAVARYLTVKVDTPDGEPGGRFLHPASRPAPRPRTRQSRSCGLKQLLASAADRGRGGGWHRDPSCAGIRFSYIPTFRNYVQSNDLTECP